MSKGTTAMVLMERRMAVPGEHELLRVRELSPLDVDEIRRDSKLISTIGASATFQRLQALVDLTLDRIELLQQRDTPSELEIEGCEAGVRAVVEARSNLLSDLENLALAVSEDEEANSPESVDLESKWEILQGLADGELTLHCNRNHVVGSTAKPFVPLIDIVKWSFHSSQTAYANALVSLQIETLDASKRIRALQVECPEGVPCLLPDEVIGADGKLTPEDIPIQFVTEALRMTRVAEMMLAESAETEGVRPPATEVMPEPEPESTTEGQGPEVEGEDPTGTDSESKPGGQEPEVEGEDPTSSGIQLVDVSGLIQLAATLNDELETAWSGALDRAAAEEGIATQMAAIRVAFAGLIQFEEHGHIRIMEPEPSAEYLEELEAEPGGAVKILVLAQLTAFSWAAQMIKPFVEPARVQIKFGPDGESLKRFWESGAFANLKGQLDLLRRLIDTNQLKSDPLNRDLESARKLRLAQASWWRGDPEACLFHAASALAVKLEIPIDELEASIDKAGLSKDAAIGLRTLRALQDGESVLPEAAVSAIHLSDAAVDLITPASAGASMPPDELFDLMAKDIPFEDLRDD